MNDKKPISELEKQTYIFLVLVMSLAVAYVIATILVGA